MVEVRRVWDVGAVLGEGPVWDKRDNGLYFVDIKSNRLHRYGVADGLQTTWVFDESLCWVIPRRGPGFIAGFRDYFALLDLDPVKIKRIGCPEPERPGNRLNDAKADGSGRVWAGSMDDGESVASGALYCINPNLSWARTDDGYCIANGPTFSRDGRTMFHADTARRVVYTYAVAEDGGLRDRNVFVEFPDSWGCPDGMTTDSEGGVWIAHWGGGCVSRFAEDGGRTHKFDLPTPNVTSCAFQGASTLLFVTTASIGRVGEQGAGDLYAIDVGFKGADPCAFGG